MLNGKDYAKGMDRGVLFGKKEAYQDIHNKLCNIQTKKLEFKLCSMIRDVKDICRKEIDEIDKLIHNK